MPLAISIPGASALVLFVKVPVTASFLKDAYSFYLSINAVQMVFIGASYVMLTVGLFFQKGKAIDRYFLIVTLILLIFVGQTSSQVRHFIVVYPFIILMHQVRAEVIDGVKGFENFRRAIIVSLIVLNLVMIFR
jgi:hypothetical protein